MIKTKEEVVQEVKDKMRELHGRVYVYTIEDVWTKPYAFDPDKEIKLEEYLVKYRKGYFYINAELSKDEVRDRRLNELGL
jgi:hypothetical protein